MSEAAVKEYRRLIHGRALHVPAEEGDPVIDDWWKRLRSDA
jgi:hypothetical protein